jgi:hypothetical protein
MIANRKSRISRLCNLYVELLERITRIEGLLLTTGPKLIEAGELAAASVVA